MLQQVTTNGVSFVVLGVNLVLIVVLTNTLIQARKTRDTYQAAMSEVSAALQRSNEGRASLAASEFRLNEGRAALAAAQGRLDTAEAALTAVIAEYKRAIANCERPASPSGKEAGWDAL